MIKITGEKKMIKIVGRGKNELKKEGKMKARDKRRRRKISISGFCKFYGNKMIFAKYFIFFASVSFPQNLSSFFSNVFRAHIVHMLC